MGGFVEKGKWMMKGRKGKKVIFDEESFKEFFNVWMSWVCCLLYFIVNWLKRNHVCIYIYIKLQKYKLKILLLKCQEKEKKQGIRL